MITLAVVNYNTKDKLARLISTLHNSVMNPSQRNWQLVVADNGSVDGSVDVLKQYESILDGVYYNSNIGYARACNQIAARHRNDIIGFLNADVWLTNNDVIQIERAFDQYPNISILGPKQRDEHGRIRHGGIFGEPHQLHPVNRGWSVLDPMDQLFRECARCLTVSGSAYFIRDSISSTLMECPVFKKLEPTAEYVFPEYPHFYEETHVSYHAAAHQLEVWYWGAVSIGHSWHASSAPGSQQHNMIEGQARFRRFLDEHGVPVN